MHRKNLPSVVFMFQNQNYLGLCTWTSKSYHQIMSPHRLGGFVFQVFKPKSPKETGFGSAEHGPALAVQRLVRMRGGGTLYMVVDHGPIMQSYLQLC